MTADSIHQTLELAFAHHQANRIAEAGKLYRQVLDLDPNQCDALHYLGVIAHQVGFPAEAMPFIRRSIELNPNAFQYFNNLSVVLCETQQFDAAIAASEQGIALNPSNPQAFNNLGNIYKDIGEIDRAVGWYRQSLALRPDPGIHSNLIYTLGLHPDADAAAILAEQARWNALYAQAAAGSIRPHDNDRSPDRPLRIGYISADLRDHPVGYNLLPLLREHDRRQFEICCYANVMRPDSITEQFRSLCGVWRNIFGTADEQADDWIRQDRIDILVDLSLHTAHNRLLLFARKPAPVQISFAGYPGGTGLPAIGYRLTDPYLDPIGADANYAERSIRLPCSFWCYDPQTPAPAPAALPALSNGYVTFGCLNSLSRVNDQVVDLWGAVLAAAPRSRLLLLAPEGRPGQRVLGRMAVHGIDPARIEFASRQPRGDYFLLYHRIDLGLDSFPYNGHTTSLDALWMGVPVITLVGRTVVGRAGLSQLTNLNLKSLCARSPAHFVEIAAALAADLPRLAKYRHALRPMMRQSPLADPHRFARDIEAAYRQIWRETCASAAT